MLVWNGRKLLDCRIPKTDLPRFAKHPAAIDELLAVGWCTEDGDDYVIRHHSDYQRTREQVLAQQSANTANGRKGGRPRKPRERASDITPETQSVSDSLSDSKSESETERDRTGQAFNGTKPTTKVFDVGECLTCLDSSELDSSGQCRNCAKAWAS